MRELSHSPFEPMVNDLLAMVGETLDEDLLEATRELRDAATEHDVADVRFTVAANEVMRLLRAKLR